MPLPPTDPSPLPAAALEAALRPFGESSQLPVEAYTAESVHEWETRHLFEATWVCVGRAAGLEGAGAQRAEAVGTSSVLLVRGADDRLRGFANLCRHRGHELLACGESVQRAVVQCPYHAWTYELDGALRLAPHAGPRVRPLDSGLVSVQIAEWGGWVFANVDATAGNFEHHVGELAELVHGWRCDELVVAATHRYEVDANWKLVCENYHECYHCPLIHPELCRVTEPASGANVRSGHGAFLGGVMALAASAATMSMSGRLVGTTRPALDAGQRRTVVYLQLFPNLLISLHPDYVMTHRLLPIGAQRTVIECEWLFSRSDVAGDDFGNVSGNGFDPSDAVDLWDVTNRQDWAAVESVQRGMTSPHYRSGVLADDEDAVYQFVAMVASAHLGMPLGRGFVPADSHRHWSR